MAAPNRPVEREERLLDVATDLLVRWGYQRVTVDEVARQAGVGKGTVYLHFRTKEALFLTVLLRTNHRVVTAMVDRLAADPAEVLPGRMMRSLYLGLAADPVTRPLYLGDSEVLGRLAHEAATALSALGERRDRVAREHFGLLREAGLLSTDHPIDGQLHMLSAIVSGFLFVDPLARPYAPADPAGRADLLEYAVAAALHAPDIAAEVAARVAPAVADLYRSLNGHIDHEWRRRVR